MRRQLLHRPPAVALAALFALLMLAGCGGGTPAAPPAPPVAAPPPAASPSPTTDAPAAAGEPVSEAGTTEGAKPGFRKITEPALTVEVPVDWSEQGDDTYSGNGVEGPAITASTDDKAFLEGFEAPGMFFAASNDLTADPDATLDGLAASGRGCTKVFRKDYDDNVYTGRFEFYDRCGPTGTELYLIAARPEDQSYGVLLLMQDNPETAKQSFLQIVETFRVVDDTKL